MQIKKYLILWKEYVRLNVARWMEYRMDFLIGIFAMFLSNATSIVFFWVIFQTIPEINGWSFGQLLFLTGFVTLVVGLWHAFFSGFSPWGIERYIRNGDFDRILLKPVNPFVDIIISKIDDDGFGDLIAGMLILYVGSQLSGVSWTLANTLLLVVMVISSLLIFLSIIIFISTLSFWITRSEGLGNIIWHFINCIH
jgi:ABC-2 type transport system permease protein